MKNEFLRNEFFLMSWLAAFQRNKTFKSLDEIKNKNEKEIIESGKTKFKKEMQQAIYKMLPQYAEEEISPERHHENIKSLMSLSKDFSDIFSSNDDKNENSIGTLNAGTAQKLLNMMLKYCWCAGWIKMPPEMPIDSHNLTTLSQLAKKQGKDDLKEEFKKLNWTSLETTPEYKDWIKKIKDVVGKEPLATWELSNWSRTFDAE